MGFFILFSFNAYVQESGQDSIDSEELKPGAAAFLEQDLGSVGSTGLGSATSSESEATNSDGVINSDKCQAQLNTAFHFGNKKHYKEIYKSCPEDGVSANQHWKDRISRNESRLANRSRCQPGSSESSITQYVEDNFKEGLDRGTFQQYVEEEIALCENSFNVIARVEKQVLLLKGASIGRIQLQSNKTRKELESAQEIGGSIQRVALEGQMNTNKSKNQHNTVAGATYARAVLKLNKNLNNWNTRFSAKERTEVENKKAEFAQLAIQHGTEVVAGIEHQDVLKSELEKVGLVENTPDPFNYCNQTPLPAECITPTNPNGDNPYSGGPGAPRIGGRSSGGSSSGGSSSGSSDSGGDSGGGIGAPDGKLAEDDSPEDPNAIKPEAGNPGAASPVVASGAGGGGTSGGSSGGAPGAGEKDKDGSGAVASRGANKLNSYKRSKARRLFKLSQRNKRKKKDFNFNPLAKLKKSKGGLNIKDSNKLKRALAQEGVRKSSGFTLFKRITRAHRKSYKARKIMVYSHNKFKN